MDRGRQVLGFLRWTRSRFPALRFTTTSTFLQPNEATQLVDTLLSKCVWERRRSSFGHVVPRDEAYYGDPGTHYTYSRREYSPLRWIPELLSLKVRVEEATPVRLVTRGVVACRDKGAIDGF